MLRIFSLSPRIFVSAFFRSLFLVHIPLSSKTKLSLSSCYKFSLLITIYANFDFFSLAEQYVPRFMYDESIHHLVRSLNNPINASRSLSLSLSLLVHTQNALSVRFSRFFLIPVYSKSNMCNIKYNRIRYCWELFTFRLSNADDSVCGFWRRVRMFESSV